MKYELRKVIANPFVTLLLLALVVANAYTYYCYCVSPINGTSSTTMQDVQAKYEEYVKGVDLQSKYDTLNTLLFGDEVDDALVWDYEFVSETLTEMNRYAETLIRIKETESYPEILEGIQNNCLVMLRLNGFSDKTSYSYRTLHKSAQVYGALNDISPEVSFSGGIERLSAWWLTDAILLVFAFAAGLILVTQERSQSYLSLLRPTKKGHAHLYIRKFMSMIGIMLIGIVLLYGANFIITGILFGFGNLFRPIQSVYGFTLCPLHLSVGEYLISFLALKILWSLTIASLIFLLCGCFEHIGSISMVVLALGGMFYVMSRQENLWLRTLSLVGNANITTLYQSCIFLNLFSYPIRQLMISILLLGGLLCISFIAGLMLHCKHHAIPTAKSPVKKWGLIVGLHTKLSAHEWRKLLLMRGGAVALAILAVVQAITYWDFDTPDDVYYRQYAEVLVGTPSDKKDAYLEAQSTYFAKIHKQIEHYSQLYGDNTEALVMLLTPLERKLVSEPAFDEAKKQYEALGEDGIFLYATGYNRLFQSRGISDDLLNTGKLFVTLIIALSGTFAVEYETGMNVLVVAAGMERRVRYLKLTQGSIFLLLGVVLSYIPQCIAVERNYGLPLISAAACNLTIFSSLPEWFPIWGIFLVVLLVHLGIGILSLSIILFLSQKIQNTVITVLISAAIFLLPLFLIKIYLL